MAQRVKACGAAARRQSRGASSLLLLLVALPVLAAGVVKIERVFRHAQYQRVVRMSKKLKAHDEGNESRVGDRVLIEETRPLSKEKRWRIRAILSRVS